MIIYTCTIIGCMHNTSICVVCKSYHILVCNTYHITFISNTSMIHHKFNLGILADHLHIHMVQYDSYIRYISIYYTYINISAYHTMVCITYHFGMFTKHTSGMNHLRYVFHTFVFAVQSRDKML